ncbi:hypothetical protein [Streptomyces sp. NPDC018610]|uniref:hypothetical protein n=1 Tax=Streptomyces sp. NPDC018610 TaxID=3365049 RepID=UPI0037A192BF
MTYARLYGPYVPVRPAPRPAVVVLAAVLWGIALVSLVWLAFLVGMASLWAAADGAQVGGFLLWCLLLVAGGAGALTGLALVPAVRRMAPDARALLLGALACPAPAVLAGCLWVIGG